MAEAPPPIRVNRAPVLTLWATVVAERLGYPPETPLTFGRFVAGSSARAKARRLGIIEDTQEPEERRARAAALKPRRRTVHLLGRDVPVLAAADGTLRAEEDLRYGDRAVLADRRGGRPGHGGNDGDEGAGERGAERGTIDARLLIELGMEPATAITEVRVFRRGGLTLNRRPNLTLAKGQIRQQNQCDKWLPGGQLSTPIANRYKTKKPE